MITKLELFGGDSKGLYMLDNELKGRVYAAPSLTPVRRMQKDFFISRKGMEKSFLITKAVERSLMVMSFPGRDVIMGGKADSMRLSEKNRENICGSVKRARGM